MQPQIWQILPSTLTEPACLAAPAYPAPGFQRGAQGRERPPWVELSVPESPLFVPQTLGMASSLQVQGVKRWCRNHFPASQPPLPGQRHGSAERAGSPVTYHPGF